MIHKTYFFKPDQYNRNGELREAPETLFHHFVEKCEQDFFARFGPMVPNQLKANTSTMLLLQACFDLDEESFGMDGDRDLETNMKIDEQSEKPLIYAIGSSISYKEEEPLFLVIDDGIQDGQLHLLYTEEDGGDGNPVNPDGDHDQMHTSKKESLIAHEKEE